MAEPEMYLTPGEVAKIFGVDTTTHRRWSNDGKIKYFRTMGGHRRYYADEVEKLAKFQFENPAQNP